MIYNLCRPVVRVMSGAIYGFARSADRAAQSADSAARFADPHIAQLICRSRSAICGSTHCTTNQQIAQRDLRIHTLHN